MNHQMKGFKFILVPIFILLCGNCYPIVTYNHTYWVKENDPRWGPMNPGDCLICVRRQSLFQGDPGELILEPYCNLLDNARPIVGHLKVGDSLLLHMLQAQETVTNTRLNFYTTDKTSRNIIVSVPDLSDSSLGNYSTLSLEQWGFRLRKK